MNSKRVYMIMLGAVSVLLIGILAGAYGINSLLQQKSQTLVNLKLQDQTLSKQQLGLTKAKKDVAAYTDLNKIAKSIVPQDKDQAQAVLEISNLAQASGINQLSSITFPASNLGGLGTAVTTTPTATPTTPAAGASKSNLTQLTPVVGISGVYQLQVTIAQTSDSPIPYTEFLDFLSRLEQNRRTAQVSSITLTPDSNHPGKVAFNLIINEFIKP